MLRWLGSGTLRSLCVRRVNRSLPSLNARFSSAPNRYLPPASTDPIPLRKQLKQEAKALRSHKKQRKESEEATRQEWELTVGVEIHAQLDTESKLFSRTPHIFCDHELFPYNLNRRGYINKRCSQFQCCIVRSSIPR